MNDFIFISYKSDEREKVRPYLEWLEKNGFKYWWDQKIVKDWNKEIWEKLDACKVVLGFMSEKSINSDGVMVEFERAKEQEKLIVVRLDNAPLDYHARVLLRGQNYIDLSSGENENEKKRLQKKLEMIFGGIALAKEENQSGQRDMYRWMKDVNNIKYFPYLVALAVLGELNHDVINFHSVDFEDHLIKAGFDPKEVFGQGGFFTRSDKLNAIGAEICTFKSEVFPQPIEYVKFKNQEDRDLVLNFIWEELDTIKKPLILWINDLVLSRDDNVIKAVAATLSLLSRRNFTSVFHYFLKPWLFSGNSRKWLCADLSISLMVSDPTLRSFMLRELLEIDLDYIETKPNEEGQLQGSQPASVVAEGESNSPIHVTRTQAGQSSQAGEDKITTEIASQTNQRNHFNLEKAKLQLKLACGYTGMSIPEVTSEILKRIDAEIETASDADRAQLVGQIKRSIKELMRRARNEAHALSLLKKFSLYLFEWASNPEGKRFTNLAEVMWMNIADNVYAGGRVTKLISIFSLLVDDDRVNLDTQSAMAKLINSCWESGVVSIRNTIKNTFSRWCKEFSENNDNSELNKNVFTQFLKELRDSAREPERIMHEVKKYGILYLLE